MNLARLFSYTRLLENSLSTRLAVHTATMAVLNNEHAREVSALERRLAAQNADYLMWRNQDLREVSDLRGSHAALLERVVIQKNMIPLDEPVRTPALTAEEKQKRGTVIDGMRRTGPVAKGQQEAEREYYAERQRLEDLRKLNTDAAVLEP